MVCQTSVPFDGVYYALVCNFPDLWLIAASDHMAVSGR
jgi:hypothetical protein